MKISKKHIFLFLIVATPVAITFYLKDRKQVARKLPIYGERFYDEQIKDTVYHTISPFKFIDQSGDTISEKDFENTIYIASFFFASCPDICPRVNKNLAYVYEKFKKSPEIKFISHTVHPENDSVEVLAEYAKRYNANPEKWHFVTGRKSELYRAIEFDYLAVKPVPEGETNFIHSDKVILLDKSRRIRGIFDGQDFRSIQELEHAIKALAYEYHESNKE